MSAITAERTAPADLEGRPFSDYGAAELAAEGERIARNFLELKGHTHKEVYECEHGMAFVSLPPEDEFEDDGDNRADAVLYEVGTGVWDGQEAIPSMNIGQEQMERYRAVTLSYAAAHPEYRVLRHDVVRISLRGERCATLRHLVNAYRLDQRED